MDNLPGSSFKLNDKMDLEKILTNKFLSGEMSFAEYSSEWYDEEEEDDNETNKKNDEESKQTVYLSEKSGTRRRKYTRLSAALLGLMGEANLRFARGDTETAERMCYEIIKQIPTAPEPYQTLAQIYENDPEKSLQFSLLAAHLSPSDATEWLRLAAISKEKNDIRQEIICYGHAIKAEPHNLDIHLKRLEVLTALENSKAPPLGIVTRVKCYHKIVTSLPASEGDSIIKYMQLATTMYHNNNEVEKALEVMAAAYKKCSNLFSLADLNIFLELLITCKHYQTCIEVFVANAGVDIEAEIQTIKNANDEIEEHTNYVNCSIPNDLAVDLKSKLLICFIYLRANTLVQTLLNDFLLNDVEKAGDLYMDIEEALSSVGEHEMALRFLDPLINNTSFDLGAVWLKHAECLNKLGREEEAIASYMKVLKHAPQHADARRKLFVILEQKGCIDEALDILQQDYKYVVSASLLYMQCCTLKKYGRWLKYLEIGETLLSRTFAKFRHHEELSIVRSLRGGLEYIHNFRIVRGENPHNDDDIHFDEKDTFKFTPKEEWDFFMELLGIAFKYGQFFSMQRLVFGSFMSKALVSSWRQEIEFLCLQTCLLNKDYTNGYKFVKDVTVKNPTTRSWNLLNFFLNETEDTYAKFLTRLFQKENIPLKNLFLGNNYLTSGRYIAALKHYLDYHEQYKDSLTALLISITILVMAAQRTSHHNLILQGMACMKTYADLRKCNQEIYYNMGRAYQMLSINNLAIQYYEKALTCGPVAVCETHGVVDLTKETAYNLYLLYKDHAPHMATEYLLNYLVI